ncbi:MAG: hypothetical protein IKI29_06210 [Clostridia bacterium]|nr:hypothetical protein [Clostridia bacterium]
MSETLERFKKFFLKPKVLMVGGISAMILILISSWFPNKTAKKTKQNSALDPDSYRSALEESVRQMVYGITGDRHPTVVVTLENGVKYYYADETKSDESSSGEKESRKESNSRSSSTVTVRSSDGGEEPLLITEWMPEVRGVTVICYDGDSPDTAEKIKNAVQAAFHITSQRIYIAGGTNHEKR